MNQKIKLMLSFLTCCFIMLVESSEEKSYSLVFIGKNDKNERVDLGAPIKINLNQLNMLGVLSDFYKDQSKLSNDERINYLVEDDFSNIRGIFNDTILPIIDEFIVIQGEIKTKDAFDYDKIILLTDKINRLKVCDYLTLKNAFNVVEYLQIPFLVKKAFANVCYDKKVEYFKKEIEENFVQQEKVAYTSFYKKLEAQEQTFIENIIDKKLLISLDDLPKKFVESNDFVGKGLRSLDGISTLVEDEIRKSRFIFTNYQKNFNFKDNLIQELNPLKLLYNHLKLNNFDYYRFVVYLRNNSLSENAKEICKEINSFVEKKYADELQKVQEKNLINNNSYNLYNRVKNTLNNPIINLIGALSGVGMHFWLAWKLNSFFSNTITSFGEKIFRPNLFKRFEKIPFKKLPFTLLMIYLTSTPYYDKVLPSIGKIVKYSIEKLRPKSLIGSFDFTDLPKQLIYILYDE